MDSNSKKQDELPSNGIVGAFCFPHGTITLDPSTRNFTGIPAMKADSKELCTKLHEAMKTQARILVSTKPELIILSTPHGLTVQNNYLFLANNLAKGSAEWDGDWKDYTAEFKIEAKLSKLFYEKLTDSKNSVARLWLGKENDPLPLRWGEVVPWYFITEAAKEADFTLPPVVFVGQAFKRLLGKKQIPELIKLGEDIHKIIMDNNELNSKRIAMVISSDLAHHHSQDPTSPFHYHTDSPIFDGLIGEWARIDYTKETLNNLTDKITKAGDFVENAGSCGYTGLAMLHGVLQNAVQSSLKYDASLLDYSAPTYYGMMVNYWLEKKNV